MSNSPREKSLSQTRIKYYLCFLKDSISFLSLFLSSFHPVKSCFVKNESMHATTKVTFFRNQVTMLWKKVKVMFTTEDDTRNSNMNMPDYKGKFPTINAVTYGIDWSAEGLETCKRMKDRRLEITTRNDLKLMEELYVGDGRNVHLMNINPDNYCIVLGEHDLKPVRSQLTNTYIHMGSPDSVWLTPDWISDGVIITPDTDNTPLGFSVGLPMTTFGPLIGTIQEKIFDA